VSAISVSTLMRSAGWVAAKSGGYHFRAEGERWVGTRDGEELLAAIARCMGEQSGERVTLA
jgi:CyaY protein